MKKLKYSYLFVLLAYNSDVLADLTILYDSDFPRMHTYVNGAGNTLHIQNTNTIYIEDNLSHTGVLGSENNAILIVDGHVHATNNNSGDAILIIGGAKGYFKNGITAVTDGAQNSYFAIASIESGSELHVTGKTNVIAPDSVGHGIYLGENTINSFEEVFIKSGKSGIYNYGVGIFNKLVSIDLIGNGAYGITNTNRNNNQLVFNDLVSIKIRPTSDSNDYSYGVRSSDQTDFNDGLVIDFVDNGYGYRRNAIYSLGSSAEVNVNNTFAVYAPKKNTTYALYAKNQGAININDALVYMTGDSTADGVGSLINMQTRDGSVIDGSVRIINNGTAYFDLTGTKWFFDKSSSLTTLNSVNSDIYFPTTSSSYKTLTVDSLSGHNNTFWMNVSLNDGSTQETDKIIINSDSTGQHKLHINNKGGLGGLTVNDGIKVVEVNGTSTADNFSLSNTVKAGIYEYTLYQGSMSNASDQSWYLRTSAEQLNPDIGSYLGNQTAATGLFMHSLHDRLGETQFAERFRRNDDNQSAGWVRLVTVGYKHLTGEGLFKQNNSGHLVHLGSDVTNWTEQNSRYHLGLMAAYGKNNTTTRSRITNNKVHGNIDGYGFGGYFTWYDNEKLPESWYVDAWTMYNWFDNETESSSYKSQAWINSIEAGYAYKFAQTGKWQWMIEPHGQIAYTYYRSDDHTDRNDMRISDSNANGFMTRLGGRFYLRDMLQQKNAQLFAEANWLHNSAQNTLKFDGKEIADNTPNNRYEAKLGLQGTVTKKLHLYSHIAMQWGKDEYERVEGQFGIRYTF